MASHTILTTHQAFVAGKHLEAAQQDPGFGHVEAMAAVQIMTIKHQAKDMALPQVAVAALDIFVKKVL